MLKKIVKMVGVLFVLLLVVLLARTLMFRSKQIHVKPVKVTVDVQQLTKHLSQGVRFKTISHQDPKKFDPKPFLAFHKFLQKTYPIVHKNLRREVVNKYSLLYTWKGSNQKLKPMMLMGHIDVVPIAPGTLKDWKYPPFSGTITKTKIWGRGTLDIKLAILGSLEAIEALLAKGFKPQRTIYLAFGHDEEIGGSQGAKQIAALLHKRGVELEFVVDEGMALTQGLMPGIQKPVALVGLAEKGYVTYKLSIRGSGGHSSMPPKSTAIGRLSRAITRLEKNPLPPTLDGPSGKMFAYIGPEMPFLQKMVFANLWLLKPVLIRLLSGKNSTNATIRTTTAVTMFTSGIKDNVLPVHASALVNFRIFPGETKKTVKAHIRNVIRDKSINIEIFQPQFSSNPSPVSRVESFGFKAIERSIKEVFPTAIVAPNLVLGGTDSRHFSTICNNILRHIPLYITPKDVKRIHGTNERILIENYANIVRFYIRLLKNSQK